MESSKDIGNVKIKTIVVQQHSHILRMVNSTAKYVEGNSAIRGRINQDGYVKIILLITKK